MLYLYPSGEIVALTFTPDVSVKGTDNNYQAKINGIVKEINPDFSVFSAYENQAMGLLVCGVDGFINATANFAPEYTVNTYQSAKRGDFNEAAKWFNKMVEAMDIYAYSTPLFLACKQAMYYRVLHHDGQERLPALSLDATAKANVYNKMRDLELL